MTFTPRAAWTDTPELVRTAVAEDLGSTIVTHTDLHTTRHAGHADILREQLDGRTGVTAEYEEPIDTAGPT